jgi:hypothetical protein
MEGKGEKIKKICANPYYSPLRIIHQGIGKFLRFFCNCRLLFVFVVVFFAVR